MPGVPKLGRAWGWGALCMFQPLPPTCHAILGADSFSAYPNPVSGCGSSFGAGKPERHPKLEARVLREAKGCCRDVAISH